MRWFPERVAYPSPLPALDLQQYWFLICQVNQRSVADGVRPQYSADDANTFVYKSLKPLRVGVGPCFTTVQQY